MVSEELLLELYNRTLADTARGFATDLTDTILQYLPPRDILILAIRRPSIPNVYGGILVPTLESKRYIPIFHSVETNDNGSGIGLKGIPQDLFRQRPVLWVDVHFSPVLGIYLPYTLEQGASRALYGAPIPSPSSLWEYTDGRIVRLQKSV